MVWRGALAVVTVTTADLLALNSDLTDNAVLQHYVDTAETVLDEDLWGTKYGSGWLTLAMHMAVCKQTPSAVGGPVTARAIDKISESYAAAGFTDAELGQTTWGRDHMMLRDSLATQVAYGTGTTQPDWGLDDERVH